MDTIQTQTSTKIMRSLSDLKDIMPDYPFIRTDSIVSLYDKLPVADSMIVQTGAVTTKGPKGSLVMPTLLTFDRTSKMIIVDNFSQLLKCVQALSVTDMKDHATYYASVSSIGKLIDYDPQLHSGYPIKMLFILVYPTIKETIISWKHTPWSSDQCKDFLVNKGILKMPRYIIK